MHMDPGALIPDIRHLEEIFIQPDSRMVSLKKRLMGLGEQEATTTRFS